MTSLSRKFTGPKLTIKQVTPSIKYSSYVKEMSMENVNKIYDEINDIYSIKYKYIGLLNSKKNLSRHFIFVKSYKNDISSKSIELNQLFYQSTGTSREKKHLNGVWLPCKYYSTGDKIFKPESNNNLKEYKNDTINNTHFLDQIKKNKRFINIHIARVSKFLKQNYKFLIDTSNSNNTTTLKTQNNSNKTIFNTTSSNLFSEDNIKYLKSLDNDTKNFKTYTFFTNVSRKNTYNNMPKLRRKSTTRLTHKLPKTLQRKTI